VAAAEVRRAMHTQVVIDRARREVRRRAKLAAPSILTRLPGSSGHFGPPRRLEPSVAAWTRRWNARCRAGDDAELVWVHDPSAAVWSPSVGVDDLDSSHAVGILRDDGPLTTGAAASWPSTFALAMPRGRVAGYYGSVITPDDALLAEASFGFVDDPRQHPVRRQVRLGHLERLDGTAASVAFGHADAYFHWLFDVLPRLEILRRAGWNDDRWDHLVVNASGAPYERETLARFGVSDEHIRQVDVHAHVIADRLVSTSTVSSSGYVPEWACRLVRDRLLPGDTAAAGPPLRLYISREDALQRRLADEDRLVALLEPLGFTCLTLSGRPLDEQVELFSRAEIVVGPHGGGLSNVVFCRPGTAVVELYADDYVNPVFWGISNHLGLRHHHVIGHPATPGLHRGYGAIDLDIDDAARLVEYALGESRRSQDLE
jgi:capsular polysaccharide biosynthesis protein